MKETGTGCFKRNRDVWAYAALALVTLLLLALYAGKKSFFTDELYRIGFYMDMGTFPELLAGIWEIRGANPPVFNLLAWLWYRLAPYGQRWLQLLPAGCTALGVFFSGMAGRAFRGRLVGVLAAVFAMVSSAVLLTAGLQFAQYGTLFLAASLMAYAYFLRNGQGTDMGWGAVIFYGAAMALLPYTHYIAVLVPMTLFVLDAALLARKQIPARALVSYGVGGGLFLPWGVAILKTTGERTEFWIQKPRILDIADTFRFLTDENGILFVLFAAGVCIALVKLLETVKTGGLDRQALQPFGAAMVPFVSVGILFVYSAAIRPDVPLYLSRYFLGCLPFVLLTEAYGAEQIFRLVAGKRAGGTAGKALCLCLALLCMLRAATTVRQDANTVFEPYREAADCLSEQPDIYEPGTAVLTSNLGAYVTDGWMEYYVTRQGRREAFRAYDYDTPFTEDMVAEYGVVYVFTEHASQPTEAARILQERYRLDEGFLEGAGCGVTRHVRQEG